MARDRGGMSLLVIIRCPPYGSSLARASLEVALAAAAFDQKVSLLFLGDGLGFILITLVGFRNRLNVFVNWTWNYLTYDRSVRIILEPDHSRNAVEPVVDNLSSG